MRWAEFWEYFWFLNYLGSGALTWLGFGIGFFAGRRRMLLLEKPRPAPNPPPRVTILIPAKDELHRITRCLQSALNQDYPNFNVIGIDDRSIDGTGEAMDALAATNPRLSILHIQPGSLAPGWTGKNNALFTGSKQADGDWFLFMDSDVLIQPDALSRTMAVVTYKKYDLISLLPRVESHSFWESLLIPLHSAAAASMYLIALNNNNTLKKFGFANGQYLLISRAAYDAIGGHETVKDRFCEDTEIARIMKERGMRPRISWGQDVMSVRMYTSFSAIIKGWSRIFYAAKVGNPKHVILAMWFLLTSCFTAFPFLAYGIDRMLHPHGNNLDYAWFVAGLLHLGLMTFFISYIYRWSKVSPANALLFIISGPLLMWTLSKALLMCITKKVEWRGTSYSHTMASNLAVKP